MILVISIHCVTTESKNSLNILTQMCNCSLIAVTHMCQNIQTVQLQLRICVKYSLFLVSVVTQCIGITRTIPAFHYYRDPSYTLWHLSSKFNWLISK